MDENQAPDLNAQLHTVLMLRLDLEVAEHESKEADRKRNHVRTALSNAETKFAQTANGVLGVSGTREMVALTRQVRRQFIKAEEAWIDG